MRCFSLHLPDAFIRSLNRRQYKDVSHYLRSCARLVDAGIDWDVVSQKSTDLAINGYSVTCPGEIFKV